MWLIVELKATPLEYGVPGISPMHMLLLLWMILAIPMIPYAFLYASLRETKGSAPSSIKAVRKPFTNMIAWLHQHRHPELLHH